jgi:hypothetical protein
LKPGRLSLSITYSIVLLLTIYTNSSYAQSSDIKITSPTEAQQIPVDIKNLPISGVFSYDSGLNCRVSFIANDRNPHQKGTWNDVLSGHYSDTKQGINKLNAKLSCNDNSMNLIKFYSVRVTPFSTESYKQFTVAYTLPRTISVESLNKYQAKTIIHINEFKMPVRISTAWNGAGNVAIPSANNSKVGKVTIPNQPGINSTVSHEQPYNPSNTPFVLAPPSSPSPSGLANTWSLQPPPIANAGPNQVIVAGSPVILNGSGSRAPGGIILSYSWRQIPTNAVITLSGVSTPVWEFTAPKVSSDTLLRFQLNVTDNLGQTGTSTVNILDHPGTFHAPPTPITKLPFVTEITKSPFVTKTPSINLNRGSNSAIHATNPTIPPPLIPSISMRISPQTYQVAGPIQDMSKT